MDWRGAGPEAARVLAWTHGREGLSLKRALRGWQIEAKGASLDLSAELGSTLEHINQFLSMQGPTLAQPRSFAELQAAALSAESVAGIREIFERSIRGGILLEGKWVFLEAGGEATLDSAIHFQEVPDASRHIFDKLPAVFTDPAGMLARLQEINDLYQRNLLLVQDIDYGGTLKSVLDRMPALEARGVPADQRERLLRVALRNALENSANSWTMDPEEQFKVIASREWSGRYMGGWHIHPPIFTPEGWAAAGSPSGPDMDNARTSGQLFVLSFHPEGFDLYDLSDLAGLAASNPDTIRKISFRSPSWRTHFEQMHRALVER